MNILLRTRIDDSKYSRYKSHQPIPNSSPQETAATNLQSILQFLSQVDQITTSFLQLSKLFRKAVQIAEGRFGSGPKLCKKRMAW